MAHMAMLFIVLPLYLCISLNFDFVHYTLLYFLMEKSNIVIFTDGLSNIHVNIVALAV